MSRKVCSSAKVSFFESPASSATVSSVGSIRIESMPSEHYIEHYIDLRFSSRGFTYSSSSDIESYDSESDFIDIPALGEKENYDRRDLGRNLHAIIPPSGFLGPSNFGKVTTEDGWETASDFLPIEFKEMRFPKVSEDTLRDDIDDFYNALTVGLDSLQRQASSAFLSADFLQQLANLLQTVDSDVRILMEKLADLRQPDSAEFLQALAEYSKVGGKILDVCKALKSSTALMKAYYISQLEPAVAAVERLVTLPKKVPRTLNVAKAEEADQCIDSARAERAHMEAQAKKLVESGSYGNLSDFVPNLNLTAAQPNFAKWSGLWGVLFAVKTVSSYISQLLLAALAYAGEGPTLVASTNVAAFDSGWATALVGLHVHARKEFNKMKDSTRCSGSFMSRDNDRLEFMLEDTKGHLQSLLDQGKFLNLGMYIGSWQADKKKLIHNLPLLRQFLLVVRHRLRKVTGSLDSLAGNMIQGQRYLAEL